MKRTHLVLLLISVALAAPGFGSESPGADPGPAGALVDSAERRRPQARIAKRQERAGERRPEAAAQPKPSETGRSLAAAPVLTSASLTVDDDIALADTTAIFKGVDPFIFDDALSNTTTGRGALANLTTGYNNTGIGTAVLGLNDEGKYNTAVGAYALQSNTTGSFNTAIGYSLLSNISGSGNTAVGDYALPNNTYGGFNNALGSSALRFNQTGSFNNAFGSSALSNNTTGLGNIAVGDLAMYGNDDGSYNIGIGGLSLYTNTTGSNNIAIGYKAGYFVSGDDNIIIANYGEPTDFRTIRIGVTDVISKTFIAGIAGNPLAGDPVTIDPVTGQLGVDFGPSSQRFKKEIEEMGESTAPLLDLRPVTFRFKEEIAGQDMPRQFGLIAEEVAEVFPELVGRDAEGRPRSVHYRSLIPMLLNELQRQQREIESLRTEVKGLRSPP
jgi:hypothetical protein